MKRINCSIITIGDELLIGQTIDTNSAWIAGQLNDMGIWVKRRVAVGDVREEIFRALKEECRESELVIITGGLGPTKDDITKPLLCEYFGGNLVENAEIKQHVIDFFNSRKRPILDVNLKQALVPDNCTVLANEVGTAAGMWFEKDEVVYISLPGVPYEMQHILTQRGFPKLKQHFHTPRIIHRTLVTSGEGESFIANRLSDFEQRLPDAIKLAYLPKLGVVKLRLTAVDIAPNDMEIFFDELKSILQPITVAEMDMEIEEVIFHRLKATGETLSIAESCTGGRLASRITGIPGSSDVFKGGFVPYSAESKVHVLDVAQNTLDTYGVISRETVLEMAEQCRMKMNSTFALSVSGHLEKQAGETAVWIGLSAEGRQFAKKILVYLDREKNATLVCNTALNLLRLFIQRQE